MSNPARGKWVIGKSSEIGSNTGQHWPELDKYLKSSRLPMNVRCLSSLAKHFRLDFYFPQSSLWVFAELPQTLPLYLSITLRWWVANLTWFPLTLTLGWRTSCHIWPWSGAPGGGPGNVRMGLRPFSNTHIHTHMHKTVLWQAVYVLSPPGTLPRSGRLTHLRVSGQLKLKGNGVRGLENTLRVPDPGAILSMQDCSLRKPWFRFS